MRWKSVVVSQDVVGVRQARVGLGVRRIVIDRSLQITDRFPDIFFRSFVPMVASLQIQFVSFGVDRLFALQPGRLLGSQNDLHLASDLPRDFALQRQDVAKITVIAFRPQVLVRDSMNQLRVDANSIAGAQY